MQFIFDDGSAENGWAINPGYSAWIGNEFPIASTYQGVLQSFDVWFGFGSGGGGPLTIDVFDATQTVVGTSDSFMTPREDWITVTLQRHPVLRHVLRHGALGYAWRRNELLRY